MLDVEIVPEMGIRHKAWEFVLGMPIQQMIDILKKQDQLIKSVNVWYNDKLPFSSNIVLVLPNEALRFHFDPFIQRLRLIEVFDLSRIALSYWSQYFNSSTVVPTLQGILRIFGSTKPVLPSETDGEYRLCYRGITFILSRATPLGLLTDQHEPASPGVFASLVASRLYVYVGNSLVDARISVDLPISCYLSNVFLERLIVERSENSTRALTFHLITQDMNTKLTGELQTHRFIRKLHFGDSVQDVLAALGSPSRIFYKTEDKMKIHLPQSLRVEQPRRSDYFFNYFTLGVDVLFHARSQRVAKFVLHTNQPGEYSFGTYCRCLFEIQLSSRSLIRVPSEVTGDGELFLQSAAGDAGLSEGMSSIQLSAITSPTASVASLLVTPFTKWSSIQNLIETEMDADPVVVYREARPRLNSFGPTEAYGYRDIVFEVIPASELLASVILYAAPG